MAFNPSNNLQDPLRNVSGEDRGFDGVTLTADTFEDGLVVGRFAKLDSGSLDNMDGSASPVVAGVVLRQAANPVEDGETVDADLYKQVEYKRSGPVTVDVVSGNTPAAFGTVFVNNVAGADAGKATTTDDGTTEPTNAEWIEEVATDVWLIRLI